MEISEAGRYKLSIPPTLPPTLLPVWKDLTQHHLHHKNQMEILELNSVHARQLAVSLFGYMI